MTVEKKKNSKRASDKTITPLNESYFQQITLFQLKHSGKNTNIKAEKIN